MASIRNAPLWAWFAADQAISSATNVGLVLVLAQSLEVAAFSSYVVLISVHQLCLGLVRTVLGESHLANAGRLDGPNDRTRALTTGLVAGLVVVALGAVMPSVTLTHALIFGLSLPAIFLQDVLRYRALATDRPWLALVADSVWLVVGVAILVAALVAGNAGAGSAVLAWALGGWAAVIVLLVLGGSVLRAASPGAAVDGAEPASTRMTRRGEFRLAADFLLARGVTDASLILMGLLGASAAVAGVKGALTLAAPAMLLVATWRSLVLRTYGPAGVTAGSIRSVHRKRWMVIAAVVVALAPFLIVPALSDFLLDETAEVARPVLLFWLLLLTVRVVMLGEYGALRALGETDVILRGRLVGSALMVPAVAIAILSDTGTPVALGLAASALWQALAYGSRVRPKVRVAASEVR